MTLEGNMDGTATQTTQESTQATASDTAKAGEATSTAAQAGQGQEAGATPDWRTSLPQELREAFGDVEPAEAAKIYARGKDYNPAQKAEDITLKLADGVEFHPGLEKMFKDFCVSNRITPAQAQAIAELNGQFHAEANRIYLDQGNAELARLFGADAGKVKDNALKAFAALDRKMDGRLSKSPGGKQMASDPLVVEALYHIYKATGEDSLGGGTSAGGEDKPMSDKDFLQQIFNKQQGAASPAH